MNYQKYFSFFVFIAVLFLMNAPSGALAQDNIKYYDPITDISMNIKELTMNVGDQYTLPLTYAPADTPNSFLKWYTNETIIHFDPENYTITALSAGKARLMVESKGGFAWDYCEIIVGGDKDQSSDRQKSGSELTGFYNSVRNKIKAESVLRYLDFLESSGFSDENFEKLAGRRFHVDAIVEPGTVTEQSKLAASLGMSKAVPLPDFSAVSMAGTLKQILDYAENNGDLVEIIEFSPILPEDPDPVEEENPAAKGMNLKDNVEELTSVSTAHDLGLKGDGTVLAIIDSGLNKDHEQFRGRVIAEFCAGWEEYEDDENVTPACYKGSSEPSRTHNKAEYNHGSHTGGIAFGRDGIAPHAKIISINNAVEACGDDSCLKIIAFDLMEVCQFLIDLQKEYKAAGKPQIVAVNMSFGKSKSFSDTCDEEYPEYKKAFDLLLENGIIPVVSSGNNGYIDQITPYGCISNSFAVGALEDDPNPTIRHSSNHSRLVNILAPGTKIWSALYVTDGDESSVCSGINCYGFKNGTSMAAPMVTGAFAILKQANPRLTPSELKSLVADMSSKTANFRPGYKNIPDHTFEYETKVLNFADIEKYIIPVPEPHDIPFTLAPILPRTGFSSAHPQALDAMPKDLNYKPLSLMLEIPTLDVLSEIVEVPLSDGEYAVSWLGNSVGLLEGSAFPGNGVTILAAHNHLNNTEIGPFVMLSSMEQGERIFIRDSSSKLLTYEVYANDKAAEDDAAAPDRIAGPYDNVLILITCEDEMVSGGYANRRIVAARMIR